MHPTALLAALQAYAQRDRLARFGEKGGNTMMAQVAQSGTSHIINKILPFSREPTADL